MRTSYMVSIMNENPVILWHTLAHQTRSLIILNVIYMLALFGSDKRHPGPRDTQINTRIHIYFLNEYTGEINRFSPPDIMLSTRHYHASCANKRSRAPINYSVLSVGPNHSGPCIVSGISSYQYNKTRSKYARTKAACRQIRQKAPPPLGKAAIRGECCVCVCMCLFANQDKS